VDGFSAERAEHRNVASKDLEETHAPTLPLETERPMGDV
jgi:hypothetical protein